MDVGMQFNLGRFNLGRSPLVCGQMVLMAGGLCLGVTMPIAAQTSSVTNDNAPLCSNRQMTTEIALSTPGYFAAICSTGYLDGEGCYVPTSYFYVGQSRSTKESVVLPATLDETSTLEIMVYKAIAAPLTYQIATNGFQATQPWTSFSVFDNGERIEHHQVRQYFGYRGCYPMPRVDGLFVPSLPLDLPEPELIPAPRAIFEPLPTITTPSYWSQEPLFLGNLIQQWDEEIARYDQQLLADPENLEAYFGRANRNYGLKRYREAIADYGEMIRLDPDHTIAYFNRALSKYYAGDFDGAIADYSLAIDKAPDWLPLASFYNNWAIAYSDSFFSSTALYLLDEAIKEDPDYAMAYYNRGILQQQWRNYDKAIADYTAAIERNPLFASAYRHRGRAYYEKAGSHGDILHLAPPTPDLDLYGKAIADYDAALDLDPEDAQAYFQRGILYYHLKNYDQAIADYSQAIALDDNYLDAYINRGIAYAEGKQDHGRAIFDFQRTKEKDSQYAPGYYNLAIGYAALDTPNLELVAAYQQQAIALNPLYQNDPNTQTQSYALQDTRQLTPILAEIISPSVARPQKNHPN